jgi:hypothetical protein
MEMKRIETHTDLLKALEQKKCVVVPDGRCFSQRIPVAFIVNMQFIIVARLIEKGMYIWERKGK